MTSTMRGTMCTRARSVGDASAAMHTRTACGSEERAAHSSNVMSHLWAAFNLGAECRAAATAHASDACTVACCTVRLLWPPMQEHRSSAAPERSTARSLHPWARLGTSAREANSPVLPCPPPSGRPHTGAWAPLHRAPDRRHKPLGMRAGLGGHHPGRGLVGPRCLLLLALLASLAWDGQVNRACRGVLLAPRWLGARSWPAAVRQRPAACVPSRPTPCNAPIPALPLPAGRPQPQPHHRTRPSASAKPRRWGGHARGCAGARPRRGRGQHAAEPV